MRARREFRARQRVLFYFSNVIMKREIVREQEQIYIHIGYGPLRVVFSFHNWASQGRASTNPIGIVHWARFRTLAPGATMAVMEASYSTVIESELGLEKTNVALVTLVGIYSIFPSRISFCDPIESGFAFKNSSSLVILL